MPDTVYYLHLIKYENYCREIRFDRRLTQWKSGIKSAHQEFFKKKKKKQREEATSPKGEEEIKMKRRMMMMYRNFDVDKKRKEESNTGEIYVRIKSDM